MSYDIRQTTRLNGPKPPFHKPEIPKSVNIQKLKRRNAVIINK